MALPPPWVDCDAIIPFEDKRLKIRCAFVRVTGLAAPGKVNNRIPGLRDGLEIGEAIAPTLTLRQLIRTSR